MVLLPENEMNLNSVGMVTLTCGTDNQGNGYLLDKLLTTKYPLAIELMELSCQLDVGEVDPAAAKRRGGSLD